MALHKGNLIIMMLGPKLCLLRSDFSGICVSGYTHHVQNLGDKEVAERTNEFRNNTKAMDEIEGFEEFYPERFNYILEITHTSKRSLVTSLQLQGIMMILPSL